MSLTFPPALALLLALPVLWWVGWPRVPHRRLRDRLSLTLRTLLTLCLIGAVAGLTWPQPSQTLAVLFLVDVSDSVGTAARSQQLQVIERALAAKRPEDRWGILVFGAEAAIDQALTTRDSVLPIRARVNSGETNIAAALTSALSYVPADATPRVVILSDGIETMGSALPVAQRAAAGGVELHYVLFPPLDEPDARVSDVLVPARLSEGQPFDVVVTVESDHETSALLLLYRNNQLISENAVRLRSGANRYTFAQQAAGSGLLTYTAQIVLADDAFSQNNRLAAFAQVEGQPRVLLVSAPDAPLSALTQALRGAGFDVEQRTPAALPADAAGLAAYRAVVIVNVPAEQFSTRQMERLQTYVRDLGGGLVFIGGDRSFGVGGYSETPIEAALPVQMTIRDEERLPRLTVAYLIDTSGSMAASDDGIVTYLELAQQAIILSLSLLRPDDRVALSSFASAGQWLARFQNVENRLLLQQVVAGLRPGGGTDILAGLRLVERDIILEPTPLKHVILLTDGGANSAGLVQTAARLYRDHGVTITAIGIGRQLPPFLEQMARVSDGRYYAVTDVSQIPTIFAQDTLLATRSYLIEQDVQPQYVALSPIMNGVSQPPVLRGYIATTLKDTAQLILSAGDPYRDPLLAQWQYGLGRSVAFTSDAVDRWAGEWLSWEDFARFWGQAVAWTITRSDDDALRVQINAEGALARVTLDARDEAGSFLNAAEFIGTVLTPEGNALPLTFRQTNAGVYSAAFVPSSEGAYFVSVVGTAPDGSTFSAREGWVRSYSREYAASPTETTLLADMAALTGGRDLREQPGAAFTPPSEPRITQQPLAPWLLLIAALLLPFDVAVRRLLITRADLERLRERWQRAAPAPSDERIHALRQARERVRVPSTGAPTIVAPSDGPPAPAPPPTASDPSNTVGALLKRRRSREASD
ncbi:MAG: VWA domain-containing protein [Anaerolineae bacterium]